jgi:cytochrome c oxidase subunit 2
MWDFPLFPDRASSIAGQVDAVYLTLVGTAGFFSVLIAVLLVRFGIKYRRNSSADRSPGKVSGVKVEAVMIGGPTLIALGIFFWAAVVFARMQTPPPDAMDIYVVAQQWMWKLQHPGGQREIDTLHVPVGQPVRLVMTSQDVIHSFYIPAFRVKQDVLPGRFTSLWYEATKTGEFDLYCAEYCGARHSGMIGRVVVMQPDQYAQWLETHNDTGPPLPMGARDGARIGGVFASLGCTNCHARDATIHAPSLEGLFGSEVRLANGQTVIADENYIRESILEPNAKIAEGYQALMPSYQGQVSPDELIELIAHIKALSPRQGPTPAPPPEGGPQR